MGGSTSRGPNEFARSQSSAVRTVDGQTDRVKDTARAARARASDESGASTAPRTPSFTVVPGAAIIQPDGSLHRSSTRVSSGRRPPRQRGTLMVDATVAQVTAAQMAALRGMHLNLPSPPKRPDPTPAQRPSMPSQQQLPVVVHPRQPMDLTPPSVADETLLGAAIDHDHLLSRLRESAAPLSAVHPSSEHDLPTANMDTSPHHHHHHYADAEAVGWSSRNRPERHQHQHRGRDERTPPLHHHQDSGVDDGAHRPADADSNPDNNDDDDYVDDHHKDDVARARSPLPSATSEAAVHHWRDDGYDAREALRRLRRPTLASAHQAYAPVLATARELTRDDVDWLHEQVTHARETGDVTALLRSRVPGARTLAKGLLAEGVGSTHPRSPRRAWRGAAKEGGGETFDLMARRARTDRLKSKDRDQALVMTADRATATASTGDERSSFRRGTVGQANRRPATAQEWGRDLYDTGDAPQPPTLPASHASVTRTHGPWLSTERRLGPKPVSNAGASSQHDAATSGLAQRMVHFHGPDRRALPITGRLMPYANLKKKHLFRELTLPPADAATRHDGADPRPDAPVPGTIESLVVPRAEGMVPAWKIAELAAIEAEVVRRRRARADDAGHPPLLSKVRPASAPRARDFKEMTTTRAIVAHATAIARTRLLAPRPGRPQAADVLPRLGSTAMGQSRRELHLRDSPTADPDFVDEADALDDDGRAPDEESDELDGVAFRRDMDHTGNAGWGATQASIVSGSKVHAMIDQGLDHTQYVHGRLRLDGRTTVAEALGIAQVGMEDAVARAAPAGNHRPAASKSANSAISATTATLAASATLAGALHARVQHDLHGPGAADAPPGDLLALHTYRRLEGASHSGAIVQKALSAAEAVPVAFARAASSAGALAGAMDLRSTGRRPPSASATAAAAAMPPSLVAQAAGAAASKTPHDTQPLNEVSARAGRRMGGSVMSAAAIRTDLGLSRRLALADMSVSAPDDTPVARPSWLR